MDSLHYKCVNPTKNLGLIKAALSPSMAARSKLHSFAYPACNPRRLSLAGRKEPYTVRCGRTSCFFKLNAPMPLALGILLILFAFLVNPAPCLGQINDPPAYSQGGVLAQAPQTAPSQSWQIEQGKLKAQGDLSGSGAGGSLQLSHGASDWLAQGTLRGGMLNDDLSMGLSLAGGWSPDGVWGLWLRLAAEATPEYVDHFQALMNLGCQITPQMRLLASLDFLNKHMENGSWSSSGQHNQYGAGLSLAYGILPGLDLAAFGLHYHTQGQEYGQVGDYEYVDSSNIQHFGLIHGGVRGGDYNQAGLDLTYRHPQHGLELGLGLSQIWRGYEQMLGHAARDESNTAASLRLGWRDILSSGVDLAGSMSQEFASQDRLSWQLGLTRAVGPLMLGLTYSELSNDQAETDRRVYCSVSLPLEAGGLNSPDQQEPNPSRRPAFQGAWLETPVSGMGEPSLKVAEPVEKRVDRTIVDLNELGDGISVSQDTMTISGLPALAALDRGYSTPASALDAFSIANGGTSVVVDLAKLPAPSYIRAVFRQRNGLFTMISLGTEQGSVKVNRVSKTESVNRAILQTILGLMEDGFSSDGSVYLSTITGPKVVEAGDLTNFSITDVKGKTDKLRWRITGQGNIVTGDRSRAITVRSLAPGTYQLTAICGSLSGDSFGYFCVARKTITVVAKGADTGDDSGDGGDSGNSGDTGGACGNFRQPGIWTMTDGSGFTLKTAIGGDGKVTWMDNGIGQASGADITNDTGGCYQGKWNGNVSGNINGKNYSYDLALSISGDKIVVGSKAKEYTNYQPGSTYGVTGWHSN